MLKLFNSPVHAPSPGVYANSERAIFADAQELVWLLAADERCQACQLIFVHDHAQHLLGSGIRETSFCQASSEQRDHRPSFQMGFRHPSISPSRSMIPPK